MEKDRFEHLKIEKDLLERISKANNDVPRLYARDEVHRDVFTLVNDVLEDKVEGDFYEFGAYKGNITILLGLIAQSLGRKVYTFDWFQGLKNFSEHDPEDRNNPKVDLHGDGGDLDANIKRYGLEDTINVIDGDILDTIKGEWPDAAFIFMDVDLYEPTKAILDCIADDRLKLSYNGIVATHDYHSGWDGIDIAFDDFAKRIGFTPCLLDSTIGYIKNTDNLTVIYVADNNPTMYNKVVGGNLIEQALHSIYSIRKKWSKSVPILVMHHFDIPNVLKERFLKYNVRFQHVCFPENMYDGACKFILKHAILLADIETPYFLYLDCDTQVCAIPKFDYSKDIQIQYENVYPFGFATPEEWTDFYGKCGLETCNLERYSKQKLSSYLESLKGNDDIFPLYNTGVIFGKRSAVMDGEAFSFFVDAVGNCEQTFKKNVKNRIDEISFGALLAKRDLDVGILPLSHHVMGEENRRLFSSGDIVIYHYLGKQLPLDLDNFEMNRKPKIMKAAEFVESLYKL